ncbi:hypothetical protein ALC53_03564 [Atta colombica]|uniref:Uncharacterized protein n=1 Tax=Atta colombica TaxID=520822 RepID=A0A195BPJ9_9HYME|nr:hypothetical protein ALC53_03564 [Atta colombica]
MTSDNASVVIEYNNSFMQRLKRRLPRLITLNCIYHSFTIVASKTCKKLPSSCSAKRCAILREFQEFFEVERNKLLKLSNIRWLVLQKCVVEFLKIGTYYFVLIVVKDKLKSGINKNFNDEIMFPNLQLLVEAVLYRLSNDIVSAINIIKELLNRQLSLKAIVNHLVEYIPINDSNNLMNILECIEKYIKRGEYWNTVRTLVLRLPPDKQRFKSILTANNFHSTVQNFGESLPETIASPDGSISLSQESPRRDNTFVDKNKDYVNIEMNGENYIMQPIEKKQDENPLFVHSCCNILRTETKIFYVLAVISDQSSQYYPVDLSRYVDKLIMLSLSKKDSNLIIEMANLVLKYTFALSTTTCRALVSTLIYMNENLAKQMYNYAERIGIYPTVKVNI